MTMRKNSARSVWPRPRLRRTTREIEALVAERQAARKRRDFAASDRIRDQLAERGIILEDSRDGGVRWKRK